MSSPFPAFGQEIGIYVSSKAGDRLTRKGAARFGSGEIRDITFHLNDSERHQTIIGFGASFLEAGMICLNSLAPQQQEEVLHALFNPRDGAGFSAMKTVVAATDFMSAGPFYSYDDVPGDVEMKHFSIARDLGPNGLITYIKRARQYGTFVLQAPMDYPPDWMLYDVNQNQDVDPKYFDALARYYAQYVKEYEKNGVFIDYLSLFNEPGVYTKIPYWKIRDLIKNHVGPLFKKEGIKTKIQLSEAPYRENAYWNYPTVLDDPEARQYVAAIPYHGYDWTHFDLVGMLSSRYPNLPMWMTEICCGTRFSTDKEKPRPRHDFEEGAFWVNQLLSDLEVGTSAWIYWNMILDEDGGPWLVSPIHEDPEGNRQHPVLIIDREKKTVAYTGLYYYLAHFSRFVRPGSVRLGTSGSEQGIRCMAFMRVDGQFVAQLVNSLNEDAEVRLEWRGRWFRVTLPAVSITTCLWKAAT